MVPRAGGHEGRMGPRAGGHEGRMGPRAGGFHQCLPRATWGPEHYLFSCGVSIWSWGSWGFYL